MSENDIENIVNQRILQARKLLFEAEEIANINFFNTSINRMYYASFSIVTALLFKNGFTPKTHSGTRILLNKHFSIENKVNKDLRRFYHEIMEMREDADYEVDKEFDEATTFQYLDKTKVFIEAIEKLIHE
ncbi:MAG: HEPN domain-containing protein [Bacteroidia bacterium]